MEEMMKVLSNIAVGVIGGSAVASLNYIKVYINNKKMEKKFPISGDFITKFEDEQDGERIMVTAPAHLKQKGKKVTGYTIFAGDNRKWIIEGEISNDGHIYGIYYAEDPIDKGIGNLFLKVDNKRLMRGLWSGFDSTNNKITSGKYVFKPVLNDHTITKLSQEYIPHLLRLSNKQFGDKYLTKHVLDNIIEDTTNYICKVTMDANDQMIGFYLANIIELKDIEKIINIPPEKIPRMLKYSNTMGVLKTIAIEDKYQGYGIGSKLSQDCIKEFRSRNIHTIFSVAWKSKDGINIGGVLETLNFEPVLEIPNYWKEDSIKNGYQCPKCENECECSAVIYVLTI